MTKNSGGGGGGGGGGTGLFSVQITTYHYPGRNLEVGTEAETVGECCLQTGWHLGSLNLALKTWKIS